MLYPSFMIQVCIISSRLGSDMFELGDNGGVNEGKLGIGIVTLTDLMWRWNDTRWERKSLFVLPKLCKA
jgi:hypothetical protein